ncbi:MAG: alpha/beta hydrolase [Planctomycetes bacterium]|nr:alpha/beta hydrolase [Planctomycetota bacterium]
MSYQATIFKGAFCRAVLGATVLIASRAEAADPKAAPAEVVQLWSAGAPHPDRTDATPKKQPDDPTLTAYLPENAQNTPAIVICPGGGYGGLAIDHEGHDIARYFRGQGVAALVLKYRLPKSKVPGAAHGVPLADAQRAIRTVRSRAAQWKIDPTRVGILGFSAGGHLASTAATHFDKGQADDADDIQRLSSRPDFAVLVYPVISADSKVWHKGSFVNLIGPALDPKLLEHYSNEKQVTKETPPTFLVHAADDRGVPVENSLKFFEALSKASVPAEMHIYERGGHGFGMRPNAGPAAGWPDLVCRWMRLHGWLGSPK